MKTFYNFLIFTIIFSIGFLSQAQKSDLLEQKLEMLEEDYSDIFIPEGITSTSYQDVNETQDSITGTIKSSARFFSDVDNLSSVMEMIPAETKVQVLEETGDYYLIRHDSIYGFVYKSKVSVPEPKYTTLPGTNEPFDEEMADQGERQQHRYAYLREKYSKETADKLYANKIWRGMTTKMVLDSWGRPKKINRYINPGNVKEEWYYRTTYLFFVDGTLEDWEIIQ